VTSVIYSGHLLNVVILSLLNNIPALSSHCLEYTFSPENYFSRWQGDLTM